jgi:hypothetical protein
MKKTIRLLLVMLTLGLAWTGAARAFTEDAEKDPIAARAEAAMWWGDIEALEALYAHARSSTGENRWNGRTPVASVRAGMTSVLRYGSLDGTYFRELEQLTARWIEQKPDSALRRLLHVRVIYARAWYLRGGGTWNTVPEQARAEFQRLIAQAQRVLTDNAKLLLPDTTTHIYLQMVGRSASWPTKSLRAVVEDGLTRAPAEQLPVLEEFITTLLPKWQGDLGQITRAIDELSPRVDAARADETYAHLWSEVASGIDGNLFRQTRADWPRVRSGFTRFAERLQDPYFRNRLAYLACLAEDRETASRVFATLGEPDFKAWRGGGAQGRPNYEACNTWLHAPR